ncbi:MAG: hypothetical protein ACYC8W_10795 [Candidatus Tyrphobacter sp.]
MRGEYSRAGSTTPEYHSWRRRISGAAIGRTASAAVLAAVAALAPAAAQSLQRVTVTSFTLTSDVQAPRVGVPFHIIVTLRLRERVKDVRDLQLPLLAELELLGDARSVTAAQNGTLYREIVTVAGHQAGAVTIPPATYDAVDARDGRAKEYATNALALRVMGPVVRRRDWVVLAWVLVSLGVAAIVLGTALAALAHRSKAVAPQPAAQAELPQLPASLGEALTLLERDPGRMGAFRAREVVRRMVDARDGETLTDVMDRARHRRPELLEILPALERATFTHDGDLPAAVARARDALARAAR